MRVPTDFCVDQQKETIVNIINDALILEGIYKGMTEIVNTELNYHTWGPEAHYNGISNAWIFLVAYEFPEEVEDALKDRLIDIFFNWVKKDFKKPFKKREKTKKLAEYIYIDWDYAINSAEIETQAARRKLERSRKAS